MATASEAIRRPATLLQTFTERLFCKLGADEDIARVVAEHLVRSNLSGHDSHGILRVPGYVGAIEGGHIKPNARPTIVREKGAGAVFDAHRGFGHFSTRVATDWTIEHASNLGIAAATIRHSHHIGRVGEYTERIAAAGLVGIATVGNAGPECGNVIPFQGRRRFLGTNPWSFGFPGLPRERDDLRRAATSSLAEGKLQVARSKSAPVPQGTLIDKEGHYTTNPHDYYAGGALTPLGGELFGHKGWGLGFAAALMGGLSMIDDPTPMRPSNATNALPDTKGMVAGVFICAIDPETFGPAERYKELVADSLEAAHAEPSSPAFTEVLVAGDPERLLRRTTRA